MSFPAYPEYRESGVEWVRSIPSHWDAVPLKNLIQIQNGEDHKAFEQNEGIPVFGSGGHFSYASKWLYDGESVLLGRKGTIDRPIYIKGKFWAVDTMFWSKISSKTIGKFIYYSSLIIPFGYYTNSTALPSMTKNILHNHIVSCPPIEEQTAIVAFLDRETGKIDALIAEQEKLLTLLAEKRQATISHAVTRGLNPNAPMKDSGVAWLGEVPEHWEITPLKRAIMFQRGHDLPLDERVEGPFSIVSSAGVSGRHNVPITSGPTIVTGRYGTIGDFYLIIDPCWPLNTSLYSISLHGNIPKYLWYMLQSISNLFILYSLKAAVPGVDRNDIHPLSVCIPGLDEQEKIVVFLDEETRAISVLREKVGRTIQLLRERRSALIAAAVTGKIDVRNAVPQGEAA